MTLLYMQYNRTITSTVDIPEVMAFHVQNVLKNKKRKKLFDLSALFCL